MSVASNLVRAIRLDTIAANHTHTSPAIGLLEDGNPLQPQRRGIPRGIARLIRFAFDRFSPAELRAWLHAPRGRAVFFAATQNQYDALAGPMAGSRNPLLVLHGAVRPGDAVGDPLKFPFATAALLSLPFIPLALWNWIITRGYARQSFSFIFDRHCLAYGMYLVWTRFFASSAPCCILVSNDHSLINRIAVEAAKDAGIRTLYLQHASVTSKFPRLTMDIALLEGQDALQKYGEAGNSPSRVYLVGMPKADRFAIRPSGRPNRTVGLCFNDYESEGDVEAIAAAVRSALPTLGVRIRPHPRTDEAKASAMRRIAQTYGCGFSDSREEHVARFLREVDILVAGESSIHLEAVLCNIRSLYYTGERKPADVYGYFRNGLVDPPITTLEGLVQALRGAVLETGTVRTRAKYYVDTIGTEKDGKSAGTVADIVGQICTQGFVSPEPWISLENEHFPEVWRAS